MFHVSIVKAALAVMEINHSFWRAHNVHKCAGVRGYALKAKARSIVAHDRVITFRG